MTALDRAFIKAYAARLSPSSPLPAVPAHEPAVAAPAVAAPAALLRASETADPSVSPPESVLALLESEPAAQETVAAAEAIDGDAEVLAPVAEFQGLRLAVVDGESDHDEVTAAEPPQAVHQEVSPASKPAKRTRGRTSKTAAPKPDASKPETAKTDTAKPRRKTSAPARRMPAGPAAADGEPAKPPRPRRARTKHQESPAAAPALALAETTMPVVGLPADVAAPAEISYELLVPAQHPIAESAALCEPAVPCVAEQEPTAAAPTAPVVVELEAAEPKVLAAEAVEPARPEPTSFDQAAAHESAPGAADEPAREAPAAHPRTEVHYVEYLAAEHVACECIVAEPVTLEQVTVQQVPPDVLPQLLSLIEQSSRRTPCAVAGAGETAAAAECPPQSEATSAAAESTVDGLSEPIAPAEPIIAAEPARATTEAPEHCHAPEQETADSSAVERLPLSAFVRPDALLDDFRPHLEVDQFVWPSAVRAILDRGGQGIASFGAQLLTLAGLGEKVLVITGGCRGEGRTSVTLAMARTVAEAGGRVVVVDADVERPELAHSLRVAPEFGWDHVLHGELPLEDVLITSLGDRLAIVPWHQSLTGGVPAFHPLRASVSLGLLREHYDLVLVDGGPLLGGARPDPLASLLRAARFDGGYLIRDCRPQAAGALATAVRIARAAGLRVLGAIENFSTPDQAAEPPQRLAA